MKSLTRLVRITEPHDLLITRPNKYVNPFVIGKHGNRKEVVTKHWQWLHGMIDAPDGEKPPKFSTIRKDMSGKRLACVCAPGQLCHGLNFLLIVNKYKRNSLF